MEQRTIELRRAEGGEDSAQFVAELANAYLALATRQG
jgi:protein subunit release factor A